MPIERVPDTNLSYHLISFDAEGRERTDDPGGRMSAQAIEAVSRGSCTHIFLLSHGWKGDVREAKNQYEKWLAPALRCAADLERLKVRAGDFHPLIIGLHWPSLPWGDEEFATGPASFGVAAGPSDEELVDLYAARLGETPATRQALGVVFREARSIPVADPDQLPVAVRDAYLVLDKEMGLGGQGMGARPGADREPFDPDRIYQATGGGAARQFGFLSNLRDRLLSPLRQLSFWRMKDRARAIGEAGIHELLRGLQAAAPHAQLHLMGHSFGCIVCSAAVVGPPGGKGLSRPVQSLVLVQGALSLWSYCSDIPYCPGAAGYFRRVVEDRVAGPVVTTQSRFDTAVSRWYPLGARVARQVAFAATHFPIYGGVGTFGLRGPGLEVVDGLLQGVDRDYGFRPGKLYNVECSRVIHKGGGQSGAHNDIAYPEIAHLVWSAAMAAGDGVRAASPTITVKEAPAADIAGEGPTLSDLIRAAGRAAAELDTRVRVEIEFDPKAR
jgi:hypothetical protein